MGADMGRTLTIIGKVWLWLAGIIIVIGYLSILYFEGWGKFQETISPFNIVNFHQFLAIVISSMVTLWLWDKYPLVFLRALFFPGNCECIVLCEVVAYVRLSSGAV